jgi:hypothetical protein
MIKHFLLFLAIGLTTATATRAQWTQTDRLANDALTGLNAVLGSIERQQQNKIFSEEKARYRQVFDDAYAAAKAFEAEKNYEEALLKYEEASKLNVKYGYTNQQPLSIKLTNLYPLAGRSEEGPSILNNATVTLSDYSGYRYMKENPIYKTKKENSWVKITRVCCSDKETRVEFECTPKDGSAKVYAMPKTYIKGNTCYAIELGKHTEALPLPTDGSIIGVLRVASIAERCLVVCLINNTVCIEIYDVVVTNHHLIIVHLALWRTVEFVISTDEAVVNERKVLTLRVALSSAVIRQQRWVIL